MLSLASRLKSEFQNKTVLITGASAGIGESLALQYASLGANLVLLARRKDRLTRLASECEKRGVKAIALECDVTRDGDLEKAVEESRRVFGTLDVVIANAGFGVAGKIEKLKVDDFRRQFETNIFGLLRTVYATLGELKKSRGRLVLLGSVAGHVSLPGSAPYSMSKFAVRALAEAITNELRPEGVSVVLISPGFVDSEIRTVDNKGVHHADVKDPIPAWIRVPTHRAASEIITAVARRKREQVVTGHGKIVVLMNRLFPGLIELVKRQGLKARPEPQS